MSIWTILCGLGLAIADVDQKSVGIGEPPVGAPPSVEISKERAFALSKILRCPVCQGLNVADSRSDAAVAMKNRIYELVAMGYSDAQIVDYFTDRYGDWVLLQPKSEHWVVWVVPGLLTVVSLIALPLYFRRRADESLETPNIEEMGTNAAQNESDNDMYRQRILSELEGE